MLALTKSFGIVGLVLLVFGIIALALTKVLNWYVWLHLILGVILIIAYIGFHFDTFMERLKQRSVAEGGKVAVYSMVIFAILVMLTVVGYRKPFTYDTTENKVHSLTEQSINVVSKLKEPMNIIAFFNVKNKDRAIIEDVIKSYKLFANDFFSFKFMDPDQNPDMATRYKTKDGDILFVAGKMPEVLESFDEAKVKKALESRIQSITYFTTQATTPELEKLRALVRTPAFKQKAIPVITDNPGEGSLLGRQYGTSEGSMLITYVQQQNIIRDVTEQAVTNAMLKVSRGENPTIYFVTGHGENPLEGQEQNGLAAIKGGIENEGYETKTLDNLAGAGVPKDADILVVSGPTQAYTEDEANRIDKFLEDGGKALFMLDPNIPDPRISKKIEVKSTGLETLAKKWGVKLGANFILQKQIELFRGETTGLNVISQKYGNHPITEPLQDQMTYYPRARSVERIDSPGGGITTAELVFSAPGANSSWAESSVEKLFLNQSAAPDGSDLLGPVPLAVASERKKDGKETRAIFFGDSDFITNGFVRSREFNYDMLLNCLNWLWGQESQITIRPKQIRSSQLLLTAEQTRVIFYAAVLTLPELVLILGLGIWWRRRSR